MSAITKLASSHKAMLGVGFSLLFLLVVISGGTIVFLARELQEDIEFVETNRLESVQIEGRIQVDLQALRTDVFYLAQTSSPDSQLALTASIDTIVARSGELFALEGHAEIDSNESHSYREFLDVYRRYLDGARHVADLSKAGRNAEASAFVTGTMWALRDSLIQLGQGLAKIDQAAVEKAEGEFDTKERRFIYVGICIMLITVSVGVAIYAFISGSLQRYVASVTAANVENEKLLGLVKERQNRVEQLVVDITSVEEEQRKRFSQELHDAIGHGLTTAIFNIDSAREEARASSGAIPRMLDLAIEGLRETLAEAKRISYELRPQLLDDFGLSRALKQLATDFEKRTGLTVVADIQTDLPRLKGQREISLYRVVQESLTNIEKHAGARNVTLQAIARDDGKLAISISDDGRGFDLSDPQVVGRTHRGLRNIVERMELAGAIVIIDTVKGKGTEINIEISVHATEHTA